MKKKKKIDDRSEKESVRNKDSETDTDRARERSGGEAKYLTQQALLANACCDHDIKDHGSMSVEKGISLRRTAMLQSYQHGTSLNNNEDVALLSAKGARSRNVDVDSTTSNCIDVDGKACEDKVDGGM